jgi:hypothetical protein
MNDAGDVKKITKFIIMLVVLLIVLIWGINFGQKTYKVWASKKDGQAELAHAEYNRQIKVYEAKAAEESAKHYAQAEIERAKGVAEANKIIGKSLKDNEAYLRYLWIQGLQTNQMSVVYVPTEAGLPILEAGRWKQLDQH